MQLEDEIGQMIKKLEQFITNIEVQSKRTQRARSLTQKAITQFSTQANDVDVVHEASWLVYIFLQDYICAFL